MEEKKKSSNPVSIWNDLSLTPPLFVFLLPELLKRNVNQHGENSAKASFPDVSGLHLQSYLSNQWQKVNSTRTAEKQTRMKQDTFSKDSFRPRNCSSYQVYVTLDSVLEGIFHNATYQQN